MREPGLTFWKVTLVEHERGWGQRDEGSTYFTDEKKARAYADENNKRNNLPYVPDVYYTRDVSPIYIENTLAKLIVKTFKPKRAKRKAKKVTS